MAAKSDLMRRSVLLVSFLFVACSSGTEPDGWQRVIGHVNPLLSSIQAVAFAPQAQVNAPFEVTVTTLGSSSCTREDGATVSQSGNLAIITPFDRVAPDGTGCTRDLRGFPRTRAGTVYNSGSGAHPCRGPQW